MDSRYAAVVGKEDFEDGAFMILGQVNSQGANNNSNENASNNQEIGLRTKFFKEIANIMPNVDEIHLTGPGQVQEQFMKFLAETPQYKNVTSTESTSNKMENEELIAFIKAHFN